MDGQEDCKGPARQRAEPDGCHQDAEDLAEVGGEQELNRLADIVVNPPAFLHCGNNGGKIVVRKHHISHIFRHIRTGNAHPDSDIRRFNRGRIVDAVARHRGDHAALFPCAHDAHLMLRLHACINGIAVHLAFKGLIVHLAELCAGDCLAGVFDDSKLFGNCHGGIEMVTRNHNRANSRLAALRHSRLHLRPDGIDHTGQSDEYKLLLQRLRFRGIRKAVIRTEGSGQHTQRFVRHRLILPQNFLAFFLRQRDFFAALPDLCAAAEHHIGRALGILDNFPLSHLMERGHHLPHGIERCLSHAWGGLFQFVFIQGKRQAIGDECRLCGLAGNGSVSLHLCVRAQRHRSGEQRLVRPKMLDDGHPVLCERSGFIRADDLRTAQRFHGGELPDDGIALGHIRHTDGKNDCHHCGQTLRDRCDRKADCNQEGIQNRLQVEVMPAQQAECKNKDADAQHQPGQNFAQLRQLLLKRRFTVLRLGNGRGDLAHFGVHARRRNNRFSAPIGNRAAHIGHVFAVSERHVLPLGRQFVHKLAHRDALARESGLLNLHARAFKQPAVRGHCIARF